MKIRPLIDPDQPVHLITNIGDTHAICGHPIRRDNRAAWIHVPHATGRALNLCPDCDTPR